MLARQYEIELSGLRYTTHPPLAPLLTSRSEVWADAFGRIQNSTVWGPFNANAGTAAVVRVRSLYPSKVIAPSSGTTAPVAPNGVCHFCAARKRPWPDQSVRVIALVGFAHRPVRPRDVGRHVGGVGEL